MTRIGVVTEQDGETRVAATPQTVGALRGLGYEVVIEGGAGAASAYPDDAYVAAGASIVDGAEAWSSPIVLKINAPTDAEIRRLADNATVIGLLSPALRPELREALATRGITALAMDAVPRISEHPWLQIL